MRLVCLRAVIVGMMASGGAMPFLSLLRLPAPARLIHMPRNPAETPHPQTPIKLGISSDQEAEKIDPRISVAPMMDCVE
jgi:hypothetical protein